MFKVEVIYKFCLVLVLILGLCMLAFSGVNFAFGEYNEYLLNAHKIVGFLILLAATLHVINRRKKLVKLMNETMDVLTRSKNPSICNMDRIIASLEPYSITEISQMLGFDKAIFCETLRKNGVKFNDASQTLRQIARMNDEKIFFVLVLIIEAKFGKRFCGELKYKRGGKLKDKKMVA
ncbi:chemotaxis protein [Campylobacter concisus]|uniref:chemotaxis protein n=1 Tax=Campylobacter concisus TaxID=199 RepID=UPI0018AC7295|nr:chemotaxis protein [Campylobacter concisus]QPI00155.1 chemotaxis protein [Campylobacter concisus]QPI01945.1 chemotaxis protein [Campylobacter concisus]